MIQKTLSLCAEGAAPGALAASVPGSARSGSGAGAGVATAPTLASQLGAVLERAAAEEPTLIWAGPLVADHPRVRDAVRYASLELYEHLMTFFDRREHTLEVCISVQKNQSD